MDVALRPRNHRSTTYCKPRQMAEKRKSKPRPSQAKPSQAKPSRNKKQKKKKKRNADIRAATVVHHSLVVASVRIEPNVSSYPYSTNHVYLEIEKTPHGEKDRRRKGR